SVSIIAIGVCSLLIAARPAQAAGDSPSARRGKVTATTTATTTTTPATSDDAPAADDAGDEKAAAKKAKGRSFGIPQVELINEQIRKAWQENKLVPSGQASDGEWCRRLFLDLLGRVPSVQELTKFTSDRSADKKLQLVNQLLGGDEKYVEEYARNWTTLWTNILIGRSGGGENDRMTNRAGLQQALRRAFQHDVPYSKMVFDIISATGVNKPGEEHFNGYVNFLAGKLDENGIQATAKTSQIFLGLQVQCTQCHNHPFNEWKQNQFWELNAFFRQTRLKRIGGNREMVTIDLSNQNFSGEDNRPDEAALFYELRKGTMEAAYPVFVDGTQVSKSGYLNDVDRRTELAKLIVASEYMPKAIVNRMWAHFLGYGFTKPVDDIGPHNAPSHPELLDKLAEEFRQNSTDLKDLIRWIVLSEPYSLSSRFSSNNKKDDPSLGEKPKFSHFYLRQMRAEELYESLLEATAAQQIGGSYEEQEKVKHEWLDQFTIAFGTDENDETTTFNGTIPQTLMMMNGDLMKKAIGTDKGSFLEEVANNPKLNNAAKINHLFLSALSRRPTAAENSAANQLMSLRGGDATAALQDVWWAVLNSNEFILNH
ncbi:MAG TPA: DUF1549 domain-containing protein, partial [Pirellulales bacterium]|nr:DUF1549 domain-containing protein [Pirellulales bacterium]